MTTGVRIRLIIFVVLSAVGIVYVTSSYLGFVDKVLGRGITVHATLPESGGLFEGSEVTYRGVKVGKVADMSPTRTGVHLDLALEEGTEIPLDAAMYVHNLSAVGEQYLDFEPSSADGPYAGSGDTFEGGRESLPVGEDELLLELDAFVNSVDGRHLRGTIRELGDLFRDTGRPLQQLLDSGSRFIDEAAEHTDETIMLLRRGRDVLRTQQAEGENIRSFARDLRLLTGALAASDDDLRTTLDQGPGAMREVEKLLMELEPTLPVLLGNMITVNQVVVTHLSGVEQLLVEFPRSVSAGFTGTPGDGWGHVNMQLDDSPPPCSGEGYKPRTEWRSPHDLTDSAIYPAKCPKGVPYLQRGSRYSPTANSAPPGGANRAGFGALSAADVLAVDQDGNPASVHLPQNLSVLGDDSWKWLMVGPVTDR